MRMVLVTLFVVLAIATLGAAGVLWTGAYNVAGNSQHTQAVYSLLERALQQSVRLRARNIRAPALDDPRLLQRGAICYRDNCAQCHGAPAIAAADFALGMQPLPGPLIDATARWRSRELYWITRNGITMSGMPAWEYRLADNDLWAVVAFVQRLSAISAREVHELSSQLTGEQCRQAKPLASDLPVAGDPSRGRIALHQHGCNGCHVIPGITGSDVHVGPPLNGIASRQLIAGSVPNTPEHMARWIRDPRSVDRWTAMPDLRVSERDARDMAAYLATLH